MILYVKEERLISLEAEEAGKRILGEKAKEANGLKEDSKLSMYPAFFWGEVVSILECSFFFFFFYLSSY